jgi:alkanesulfonate monooxygenase SsuD/methylene tetrahydromethanopterin reductase-like flavin-dependent oxidoreductase (luciferase family)
VADGLIVHPFNNQEFLANHAMPALQRGIERGQRTREDLTVSISAICITGNHEQEYLAARQTVANLLGFYGSTPAYRPPMDAVGMGELQPELNRLSKAGEWQAMGELIDEDFINAFAVCGEPQTIARQLWDKYGPYADRLSIYAPYQTDPDVWPSIIAELKQLAGRS